jgi:hypothetical protein
MYVTSLSDPGIVDQHCRELGLPLTFLSALCGVCSTNTLHSWLCGTANLSDAKSQEIVKVVRLLKEISEIAKPWPLDFHDARLWKELLADYRANASTEVVEGK